MRSHPHICFPNLDQMGPPCLGGRMTQATVNLKIIHNLKVHSYILFGRNFQDFKPSAASQKTLRDLLQRGEIGEPEYTEVLQKNRAGNLNIKILLLIKGKTHTQGIQCFSMYGKMQESGFTEIIPLIYTSGGEHGNPLQYSYLENPRRQRSLVGDSPQGHKGLEATQHKMHLSYLGMISYVFMSGVPQDSLQGVAAV